MSALKAAVKDLVDHPNRPLSRQRLLDAAKEILEGRASTPLLCAFLVALRMIGETGHEIETFVEVMLDHAKPFPRQQFDGPVLDTCGTGGDAHNTFNISTTAALITAAAGVRVAKHGNRAASSKCGSADVLEHMGLQVEISAEEAARQLAEYNFCFLYARLYHPALRHAAEARKELGLRTLLNVCGPLSNPARPTHQLVGVAARELIEPVAEALRMLGCRGALVVHGADGMDEISLTQVTEGVHLDDAGRLHPWHIAPSDFGIKPVELAELVGGDAAENARIVREVLEGGSGPHADIVNLNVAAALWVSGVERTIEQGYAHARDVQRSAGGARLLKRLIAEQRA